MTRSQRWAARNPAKRAAHKAVERALRNGTLTRTACVDCGAGHDAIVNGKAIKLHACHDDYARPLDVVFKCPACHIGRDHWATPAWRAACRGVRIDVTVTTKTVTVTTVTRTRVA